MNTMNWVIVKKFCEGYIKGAVGAAIVGSAIAGTVWLIANAKVQ
jgi:hypothetical protein